ncbi:MAG: hypothetical protein IJY65_00300 [Clostridia bacterium]|nr:hypothetical protein [Clostridia bacterium]
MSKNEKSTKDAIAELKRTFAPITDHVRNSSPVSIIIQLAIASAVVLFISIYFALTPLNIYSETTRTVLVLLLALWSLPAIARKRKDKEWLKSVKEHLINLPLYLLVLFVSLNVMVSIIGAPIFRASSYRDLITVTDNASFTESVEDYTTMQIPVVDKALAEKLGDKKLGEDNLGSQYEVGDYYMICHNNNLYWIAPIEYSGLFKWMDQETSPGYLFINANDPEDVSLVRRELKYVDSAFLWDDLQRNNYFGNLTAWRAGNTHLELTDEGDPMFVESVFINKINYKSGTDIVGIIVTDPTSGQTTYYDVEDAPTWINHVQDEDMIVEQLNYWGDYVNGFWNTLFAQKDILNVSTGINYVYSNGNMYLQTGMTSVGSDESIVGVMMVDMRTKEAMFCRIGGATEWAAAQSAVGYEQSMRFTSSDPIMINLDGVPTYFTMLKDEEGLVKRYAYVNVANYTIVSTAEHQADALTQYKVKINKDDSANNQKTAVFVIRDSVSVVTGGETYYYMRFLTESGEAVDGVYICPVSVNANLPFLTFTQKVEITFTESEGGVYNISKLSMVE